MEFVEQYVQLGCSTRIWQLIVNVSFVVVTARTVKLILQLHLFAVQVDVPSAFTMHLIVYVTHVILLATHVLTGEI